MWKLLLVLFSLSRVDGIPNTFFNLRVYQNDSGVFVMVQHYNRPYVSIHLDHQYDHLEYIINVNHIFTRIYKQDHKDLDNDFMLIWRTMYGVDYKVTLTFINSHTYTILDIGADLSSDTMPHCTPFYQWVNTTIPSPKYWDYIDVKIENAKFAHWNMWSWGICALGIIAGIKSRLGYNLAMQW